MDADAEPNDNVVQEILAHRVVGGGLQFLVRWEGQTEEKNSWVRVEDFLKE